MKLLGISRSAQYSPNMQGPDALIFLMVADGLRHAGAEVSCISEGEMLKADLTDVDAVFTMSRDVDALSRFNVDVPCFNSIEGILLCSHKARVAQTFACHGIPQPAMGDAAAFPLWVKNGDSCAQQRSDTVLVHDEAEMRRAEDAMRSRGVGEVLRQSHVVGDLVKFYGVEGTPFFHWVYASMSHSKFGLEAANDEPQGLPFDALRLKTVADEAARALNVPIYGGDCVVDAQGAIHIIDFNDWPSFSSCREEAAEAIVRRITQGLL